MAICLSENFNKEKHLYTLDFVNKLQSDNVNDLIEEIYKVLEGAPFSTSINDSSDTDNYKHSIDEFITCLGDILQKNASIKLAVKDINSIKRGLAQRMLPAPLTKAEQIISAVIEGTDLIKQEDIDKMRYTRVVQSFYGQSNLSVDNWRLQNFEDALGGATIFGEKVGIVDNDFDLNNNIINYQESQYQIMRNYLQKYHFKSLDTSIFPQHYYTNSRIDPSVKVQTSNSQNTFTAMYNIINHLKQTNEFKDLLEKGWNDDIMQIAKTSREREFFKAVSAYLNLTYFDQTLKGSQTSFVSITRQDMPIEVVVGENGKRNYTYKYHIEVGNSNAVKTWGVENTDAIKQMSNFNKYLINRIPIYNTEQIDSGTNLPTRQFGRLESKDFIGTMVKLIELGTNLKGSQVKEQFAKDCASLINNPSLVDGPLYRVFKTFFGNTDEKKTSVIDALKENGFDINNINILYSIYHTVFDVSNKESWYNLENKYRKTGKGFRSRYNLVENAYNIICSNASLNYLSTTYNSETGEYETQVKEKYSINSTKFDIKNSINNYTLNRDDRKTLLKTYELTQQEDKLSYSIKIGKSNYLIKVKSDPRKAINILSKKKATSSDYIIEELEKFKSINLNNSNTREEIINATNGINYEFKQLLNFIGDMLDIRFTNSVADLNELNMAMMGDSNFLKNMFISATRALVVNDIYDKFDKATKEGGSSYNKTELIQYMKDTGDWPSIVSVKGYEANEYFDSTKIGSQLNVVYVNEPWVTKLARVKAILAQDTVTSVITDLQGNKNPNMSPTYLNSTEEIKNQISISNAAELPTANLLFSQKKGALLSSTVNLDIQTDTFATKQVKSMTQQELIYDAIINKFFVPLIKNNTVFTQCTTQSDKTKFIATHINMAALGFDRNSVNSINLENQVLDKYINTIGAAYKGIYKNILDDYKKVFPELTSIEKINDALQGRLTVLVNGQPTKINNEKALIQAVNIHNKNNPKDQVVFYKDLTYRVTNSGLAFNELLYDFATNLYANTANLAVRLKLEKIRFLNNLMDNQVFFKVTPQLKSIVTKLFGVDYASQWIKQIGEGTGPYAPKQEYLILAKKGATDILYGNINENESIQLNPLLNAYFLLDNLIGNNLRFQSTGSEINHKIKALSKLNLKDRLIKLVGLSDNDIILQNQLNSITKGIDNLTFYDLNSIKNNLKQLISTNPEYTELYQIVNSLYNDQLYAMENLGQNAQFKRNVIMSATMTKMVPSLEGITDTMKIACIDDIKAEVFNFSGKHEGVDAHDGSALVSGLWSVLENKSLGSNEVGNIKKPIHHDYNNRYMTATLLKYATDAITNNWMRQSVGNDLNGSKHAINLHHIFKKMHHVRWHDSTNNWVDGEIDLVKGCGFRKDGKINFKRDILEQDINENNELYYNKGGQHIKICDFGVENGIYYTMEQAFNTSPTDMSGKLTKVYHYFDNNGQHFPSDHILSEAERITKDYALHTIDSLFELHTALGGIWSEQWNGDKYEYSEGSMIATVNFINNVTTFKKIEGESAKSEKVRREDISIANYDQPLKRAMVHMLANNSAVKNGVGNINPNTSWYDDSEFSYITISTNNYGIQQDSDHTADEAHMTEFSQVVSSLDAGGQLHDYVSQIYEQLGQTALDLADIELSAVKNFRETGDKSILYDVLGRTIMANLRTGNSSIGLADAIITNIKKAFNLNTDHGLDSLKIPFSDPNIYSQIISTFVSNLNKKSIKRQYPGLGTVMAPSYNMSMIFDININGTYQQYQFTDLIKLAKLRNITSTFKDTTKANQDIVRQLLRQEQDKIIPESTVGSFLPTENVLVTFDTVSKTGDRIKAEAHISFKGALDYYKFQDNPFLYLQEKGYSVLPDSKLDFSKDVTVPRNLAPARIEFDIEVKDGTSNRVIHTNVFNSWRVRQQILELEALDKDKSIKGEKKKELEKAIRQKYDVDSVFTNLKKGLFELEDGTMVPVTNLKNQAAEIIMSNLYQTKFGIKSGDSLVDVLATGKKYFKIPELGVFSDTYDLVFTKGNGNHLFLTFKPLQKNTDTFKSKSKDWVNKSKKPYIKEYELASDSPEVVNKIYAITPDNIKLFEVGREIINESVTWDSDQNCFVKNGKKVDNQSNFRRRGNDVLEYVEFLTQHEVTETFEKGVKKTYTLYNINRQNIARCLEYKKERSEKELTRYKKNKEGEKEAYKITEQNKRDEEVNDFISHLLHDIYSTDSFAGVDINSSISAGSRAVLNNTLNGFAEKINFDPDLKNYIKKIQGKVHDAKINKETGIYELKNTKIIRDLFYQKMRDKQYTSFKKSLEFTVARIPAQTLQSFMKMKNVGFTGTETGQCFVTAWQTWLQGSDPC